VFVHDPETRAKALALVEAGENDCEVARRLGVPRTTVRDWRRTKDRPRELKGEICTRCWRPSLKPIIFTAQDYAELLGLYLGDGYIVRTGRSDRLRIYFDTRYIRIVSEAETLLRRCFPAHGVGRLTSAKGTTTILSLYCTHLACLFPQHGAGRKHQRDIILEDWQTAIVSREPWSFIRGLIRSDGCAFVNRTGRYAYLSYEFSNRSSQIRELFMDACDRVGVEYRAYRRYVRIYRRPSVALMEQHAGLKA
jgi:Homeodomain-like domain/LAGLIDADG-like domain